MKPLNPSTPTNENPPVKEQKRSWPILVLLGFLLVILVFNTLPGYLSWSWPWMAPPRVVALKQLREMRKDGLVIPGWQTTEHSEIPLGGHKWSYQRLEGDWDQPVLLLLLAQNSSEDQPRVEWVDVNGFQQQVFGQWQTDSYQTKTWMVANPNSPEELVKGRSRFFRGWSSVQTYALLQWYAWPTGGDPAPVQWFMADRKAQTQGDRAPWIAVCLMIPIEPLGDIEEEAGAIANSLAETLQTTLMETAFAIKN